MSISSIGSGFQGGDMQAMMLTRLQGAGLSKSLASTAQSEVQSAVQGLGGNSGGGGFDPGKIKDAVSSQLATDVKSGKLTQDQSDKISAALDKVGQQFGPPPGGANGPLGGGQPGAQRPGGNGGGSLSIALQLLQSSSSTSTSSSGTTNGHHQQNGAASNQSDTSQYLSQLLQRGVMNVSA